jgi:Domain of unknown function (DUF927)
MPREPLTLAAKPGLRGKDGFVLGKRNVGTAKERFRWKSPLVNQRGKIGDRSDDWDSWNVDVGKVALKSSFLTFGLCLSLASPLPSYVRAHAGKRLLSETAVFNLSGESGSGKSTIARAAAGLFGPPDLIAKWDFSRRGLEEYSESRNDLLAILDDLETHTEEAGSLRTALRYANQVLTSSQSKLISTHADLPFLTCQLAERRAGLEAGRRPSWRGSCPLHSPPRTWDSWTPATTEIPASSSRSTV